MGLDSAHAGGEHLEKCHPVLSGGDLTDVEDLCLYCCWDDYHLLHDSVCVGEDLEDEKKTCHTLHNDRLALAQAA